MEAANLEATRRDKLGTKHTRRLRQQGRLPAIIYGHGEDPDPIALPAHDVEVELHHGARVLDLQLEGKTNPFLIKSVQYDYLGTTPIHLDLLRVDLNETVTVRVGIELKGVAKGVSEGGVLDQHLADIEVECLVTDIPDTLTPLVAHLGVGDSLLVGDLDLPEGVKPMADPGDRVATITLLAEEVAEEAEAEEEAEEEAQPEVISRGKKEEEQKPGEGKD